MDELQDHAREHGKQTQKKGMKTTIDVMILEHRLRYSKQTQFKCGYEEHIA